MDTNRNQSIRREWRSHNGWLAGVIVIVIGVLFLLHNFGIRLVFFEYHNWWAIVILIFSLAPLSLAYRHYRETGKWDANMVYYLTSGAAILTVGLIFLLHLRWDRWWPLFLIYGGCWMLVRRSYRSESGDSRDHKNDADDA